ncbi:MAG: tyrosine-type recombinase/integrase [Acidobacteriia bacterium]|nr:tyrosine-type recombinase/integrase [Terriglobia bacterium]MYG01808.1 tyrosine-type recombinase/integrase [Terriglobia bacterium]MYK08451.1 tyrosine-type recombinase/integrase [Terriglobia bacterium]
MLIDLFPRAHARFQKLPLLGDHLDGLAQQLTVQGFRPSRIRRRICKAPVLEAMLASLGIRDLGELSRERLLSLAPRPARNQRELSALVRSMAAFLADRDLVQGVDPGPGEVLVRSYLEFLRQVRGLAVSTLRHHRRTALDLLKFLGYDDRPEVLETISSQHIEAFVVQGAKTLGRGSLQHLVSQLRCLLRFLATRGEVASGLDAHIDTPPTYRDEQLPRAQPWEAVQALLAEIDCTTPVGRRDYAMCLLMATYGLRASEVAALQLDSLLWRSGQIRLDRPKGRKPLALPLTDEVGTALVDYLRHGRPRSQHRRVFLGSRQPVVPLRPGAVRAAFRRRVQRSGTGFPDAGTHCVRHSLAIHLLRSDVSIESIGGLLGHRSLVTTGQYLRLDDNALRAAALDLPLPVKEVRP